jgi:hsp70-interacting protein
MDPGLNGLLKWSVENSTTTANDPDAAPPINRGFNPEAIASLFGGPSDADLMKESMSAILSTDPEMDLEARLVAFDNFEQLIENLDNANLLEPLALWGALLSCLKHDEGEIRKMAAWCVGTAVQNNEKSQKMCFKEGGVAPLTELATDKSQAQDVRRKAIYALSSLLRNFQDAMDEFVEEMKKRGTNFGVVDAGDMDAVDGIVQGMREEAKNDA